jgi:hypothetical protein
VHELPVILVDDSHSQVERSQGADSEIYRLASGPGFILDATGYTFRVPLELGGQPPNLIQLVCGAGQMYECPWWDGKTRYVITGDTVKPARGCIRLRSFESGEVLCLAIGKYTPPSHPLGQGDFHPYWVSMIFVA